MNKNTKLRPFRLHLGVYKREKAMILRITADFLCVLVYVAEMRSREHVLCFSSQYTTVLFINGQFMKVRSKDLTGR